MSESFEEMERIFLALSDKTRIRLIHLMSDGEVSVNYLCESLGESQPKVSRHLAYLRTMGTVNTRRDGKRIFYSLSWPESRNGSRFFQDTLRWIASISTGGATTGQARPENAKPPIRQMESETEKNIFEESHMKNDENRELDVYLL